MNWDLENTLRETVIQTTNRKLGLCAEFGPTVVSVWSLPLFFFNNQEISPRSKFLTSHETSKDLAMLDLYSSKEPICWNPMSHMRNTLSASLPTILPSRPFHPCVWPPDPHGYPGIIPIPRNPLSVYTEWKAAKASLGNSLPNSSKYFLLQKCSSCENHEKDLEAFLSGVTKRQRMDQVPPDLFCLTYTVFF